MDEEDQVEPQMFGQVASFYYLKHETMAVFAKNLTAGLGIPKVGPGLVLTTVTLQSMAS